MVLFSALNKSVDNDGAPKVTLNTSRLTEIGAEARKTFVLPL